MAHDSGHYVIKFENNLYISENLYAKAFTDGKRYTFFNFLKKGKVSGVKLLDQIVYPITKEQYEVCKKFKYEYQDFDKIIRYFNIVSKDILKEISNGGSETYPNASTIRVDKKSVPKTFTYKNITFLRIRDCKGDAYRLYNKIAHIKLCSCRYVALDAVNISMEMPIIATLT